MDHNRSNDNVGHPYFERRLIGHRGEVTGLSFHPDCMQLVSSSTDLKLFLWNLKKGASAITFENHEDQITDVHFLPNGKEFVSSSTDRTVRLWTPSIKSHCEVIKAHSAAVRSVHASADSSILLSASDDKTMKMWMTEDSNKFVSTFEGHNHWVNCARFSADGKHIVSCSEDRSIKLWDRRTNCSTHTFEEKEVPKYVEFHPTNKYIGVASSHGPIKIYDIRNHKLLQSYEQSANKLAFHPRGHFLVFGCSDGSIQVYNLKEYRCVYTIKNGHTDAVMAVAFSSDGNRLATAGADKQVVVWDTKCLKEQSARLLEKYSKSNIEGTSRTVDARLMKQTEVDVPSSSSSRTVEIVEKEVADQGEKVRAMKQGGKPKSEWQPEVDRLLNLKKELAALKGGPDPSVKQKSKK